MVINKENKFIYCHFVNLRQLNVREMFHKNINQWMKTTVKVTDETLLTLTTTLDFMKLVLTVIG